ncbi:MAG: hypothetical protein R3Y12_01720 [Clostridia bacterium]
MELFRELVFSVTVVAIFSTIILSIVGEDNALREIVRISCGLLMIIVILTGVKGVYFVKIMEFENFYEEYEQITEEALINYANLERNLVKNNLEMLVLNQTGESSEVFLDENYEIIKIIVNSTEKITEISKLLGISVSKIEYIESR